MATIFYYLLLIDLIYSQLAIVIISLFYQKLITCTQNNVLCDSVKYVVFQQKV